MMKLSFDTTKKLDEIIIYNLYDKLYIMIC